MKVGSSYPSLTPALIIDQNKGSEKGPQGQTEKCGENPEKIKTLISRGNLYSNH